MEKKRKLVVSAVIILLVIMSLCFAETSLNRKEKKFEVDNVLLKFSVRQGDFVSKTIKITNVDLVRHDFEIKIKNLEFVSIKEQKFSLNAGESRILEVKFDIRNKGEGVYIGEISISSVGEILSIPVVLEIESKEILFDINLNVPPEYNTVLSGEEAIIETKIFNLEDIGLKTVEMNYFVEDFKGKIIFSEQENIAVENQVLITKIISIPKDTEEGNYVFAAVAKYGDSVGTSSYFFKIVKEKSERTESSIYMWIVFILLLVIILFMLYNARQRDKFFLELERQHKQELRKEIERLDKEREKIQKLNVDKRKKKLKEFRENKKKRLKAVKIIYRTRIKVLKKLKKQKKKNEMQKKLGEWKKQGYNVNEFLIKTGGKKTNLKEKVQNLKKQGYKL